MEDLVHRVFNLSELRGIATRIDSQGLSPEQLGLCNAVANELELTGVLIVRAEDRINEANEAFQDLLQEYFRQSATEKDKDVRADISYQVMSCVLSMLWSPSQSSPYSHASAGWTHTLRCGKASHPCGRLPDWYCLGSSSSTAVAHTDDNCSRQLPTSVLMAMCAAGPGTTG
jgi:hypothetical protein